MINSGLKYAGAAAALIGVGLLTGCTTGGSFVNYDERNMYSSDTAGNIQYVEIGAVEASTRGFVWNRCEDMSTEVAEDLREEVRQVGGNAVINVTWTDFDSGMKMAQPGCTTAWGWAALGGVGILHPWVKRVQAQGIAIYADEEQIEDLRDSIAENRMVVAEERAEERAEEATTEDEPESGSDAFDAGEGEEDEAQ